MSGSSRSWMSPISGSVSRATGRRRCTRCAVSTCASRAGEIVGLVGEVRLGQDHAGARRDGAGAGARRDRARAGAVRRPQPGGARRRSARRSVLGRELVMVIPNPRAELNPVLTVGRQISNVVLLSLGRRARKPTVSRSTMLRAVRIPDPERRFAAYPHELSGGMAQRVVIAIALVCSPRLVISDDATSGLDVTVQSQVLDLLQTMVREKDAATLFITRDLAITAHFCTRIAMIYAGEIVEIADDAQLLRAAAASVQHHAARSLLAQSGAAGEAGRDREELQPGRRAAGCAFAARCVRRQPRCLSEAPALRPDRRRPRGALPFSGGGRGMTAMLDVQNLVKRFPLAGTGKVVQAVNDVSFSDRPRRNACPRRRIRFRQDHSRALHPRPDRRDRRRQVRFDGERMGRGRDIRSKALRGRIQLVFQEPAESLDPRIRVGETLAEPLRHLGMPACRPRARAREIAEHLGLKPRVLEQFPAGTECRPAAADRHRPRHRHATRTRHPR